MSASPYKTVYEVDASTLDTGGTIVPTDLDEEVAAYSFGGNGYKTEWGIKVVNDADQDIDATPLLSTSDDDDFAEYDTVEGLNVTVPSGTSPDNTELLDSDLLGAYLGIELAPAAAATGTVKIVFQSRNMG